jgi:diguanylate cyclase (GGDEF)-like protein
MVLAIKRRFNVEGLYINILIVLLFGVMFFVGYQTLERQEENIKIEVDNTAREFETRIKAGVASVLYLHAAAEEIYKNRALSLKYAKKVHEVNAQGDFVLDIPVLSNLTGFGGLEKNKEVLHEMASSLELTRYFAIVKGLNKSFVRVYYASKHNFATSYPYVWSDQYMWNVFMMQKPPWIYATPAVNPTGELFFTPLHKEMQNNRLLLTIGHPVYSKKKFLGTVNLDISVASESAFLDSKNQYDATYVIVNSSGQIIAASGLDGYTTTAIFNAKELLDEKLLNMPFTEGEHSEFGDDYVCIKKFEMVPWKLIYLKKKTELYITPLYYVGMLMAIIVLLFGVKLLIGRLADSRNELERQALTDPMTKLYNRRYLSEITQHMLGLMRRSSSKLTVIMLDIDKFKNVNDTYGHQVGDEVIIKLAQTLQEHTRKSDVICRLGGEEFLVLLPETDIEGAMLKAETFRTEVEKLRMTLADEVELTFTISLGVSEVWIDEENFDAAMSRADAALYEAKESGRNKVCLDKVKDPSKEVSDTSLNM